ncbi:MAG: HAD family hydrolase [Halocynthiibacter sp.]
MPEISAVIFDIGNVLIEWQPERYYDARFGEARRKAMFETVDLHAMNDRIDRGEGFKDVVYETADLYPAFRDEIRLWHDDWAALATPEISLSVTLLRALRKTGTPVFTLTNFGIETFEIGEAAYPFLKEFDRRYISGHMKCIKPDAQIYDMVEKDCALPAGELLFTDDRIDNIKAAASRGWHTHHFTSPEGWRDCLFSHGLLQAKDIL